jgi:hypothetical protein
MSQETKKCQNCKREFVIEPDDFDFYQKIKVPPPTFCPDCREQRRIAFRNERSFYKKKCDLCGKDVVSRVSPDKPYPMYCQKCWWSDKWNPLSFGRDYDFSKPFFEQFKELLFSTPHISIFNANTVNSDWVNQETDDKNCYLNVGGHFNEDSAYNTYELYGKDCFDNLWIFQNELCYENINCERCYRTLFSQNCFDCLDTVFSYDCRNCQNCFGCAGLRNKQYYIFNKPYSKEDYQKFLKTNLPSSHKNLLTLKEKAGKTWLSVPHRDTFIVKSVNSWGNFIGNSKNAKNCWNGEKIEDSKHLYINGYLKDCYDCSSFGWGELCYEGAHSGGSYNSKFFSFILGGAQAEKIHSSNLEYCYAILTSHNCFGCANLRNQEYCILNKRYSKTEYETLIPKIKKHMEEMPYIDKKGRVYKYGEFFPMELSPFGYNETAAQDYYPLTRQEALEKGYPWFDYESEIKYQFSDYQIPDDISDVKDDILEKVLKCEASGGAYKIIPMELQFYRRMGLPVPHRSPLQRHKDRISLLPPRKLYQRHCQKCQKEIQTVYAPERPEIVYCEQCYLSEVV